MNRHRVKRSSKSPRPNTPLSFTADTDDTQDVPNPTGTTPPPDQDPDK